MPIYEYRLETGGVIEVYQKPNDAVFRAFGEIPEDQKLSESGFDSQAVSPNEPVIRMPANPGGFQGLPTPKFYKRGN